MVRKIQSRNLGSKEARRALKVSGKPYFVSIGQGLHLGYRRTAGAAKPNGAGKWVVRSYLGDREYRVETIGTADDALPAIDRALTVEDAGRDLVLSYEQAQRLCWALWQQWEAERTAPEEEAPYTVNDALDDYFAHLEFLGQSTTDSEGRAKRHIRPRLGDRLVQDLTAEDLREWLTAIATAAPIRRHKRGSEPAVGKVDTSDSEAVRRRRGTANRTMTILKAALNLAFQNSKTPTDTAWRRVKAFRDVGAARVRYLQVAEALRLINASSGDFRALVEAALATGARYSEIARMRVKDVNFDSGTVHVPKSKSGKQRDIILNEEGIALFRELTAGKSGEDLIFAHEVGGERMAWGETHQSRPMAEAVARAKITPPISFHGLRHTWASHAVMNGVPLMVVALNLGHADTRMVEKYYGHLSPSYKADAIRKGAPTFGAKRGNIAVIG